MSDLISRQAVLDMLDEIEGEVMDGEGYKYGKWSEYVEQLPSAQPQRMRGRWERDEKTEREAQLRFTKVYRCSNCKYQSVGNNLLNFCPNCGADMREGQDETD